MATATGAASGATAQGRFIAGHARTDGEKLLEQEAYWGHRQGYPTGHVEPAWVRRAAEQHTRNLRRNPDGKSARISTKSLQASPLGLSNTAFTALGPAARAHDRLLRLLRLRNDRGPRQRHRG